MYFESSNHAHMLYIYKEIQQVKNASFKNGDIYLCAKETELFIEQPEEIDGKQKYIYLIHISR